MNGTRYRKLPVLRYAIYEAYHAGKHLDTQFFNQPRHVLNEDTEKSSRKIFWGKLLCVNVDRINKMIREVTYSKMLIHDLASLEVRMVEMHHTSWFSSIATDLSRDPNDEEIATDSRTHSYHLFFTRDLRVPAMFIFFHFFHAIHPVMNVVSACWFGH